MNLSEHTYNVSVRWTGNLGTGTSGYREYSRENEVTAAGPPLLPGTADPTFHGQKDRWNPEQLLLAALSQCHLLSFLHVAVKAGVVVNTYDDDAEGLMRLNRDGTGEFTRVVLRPRVTVASPEGLEKAAELHAQAAATCFIARSVNFPVDHEPVTVLADPAVA
ncbi:OsmC family protein [Arthrobacter sp. TMN-37]